MTKLVNSSESSLSESCSFFSVFLGYKAVQSIPQLQNSKVWFSWQAKMISCFNVRKWTEEGERKRLFMKNGSLLLEELVASCDGKCNPIRSFSAEEVKKATNNFDSQQVIAGTDDWVLYNGVLQDRPVSIKRYKANEARDFRPPVSPITDIVIGSQMSAHKNALKLLGCCLETISPIIVYEFVCNQTLFNFLFGSNGTDRPSLSWKQRIKIAMGIANGVAYLHTALSRPVIHRDIKPETVIVDAEFNAKLIDFSSSIAIPDGESHVDDYVLGTAGYVAPEYLHTGFATEKVDVFSFGVVLIQLLTGRKAFEKINRGGQLHINFVQWMENGKLLKNVDASILGEGMELQNLLPFATLALSCIRRAAEDRPTMISVAKELKQIYHSVPISFPSS